MEGFIFRSKSQPSEVHQARRDGYTFSRLAPYEDWAGLKAGAFAGWSEYKAVLEPDELHAVAVRFINRLSFPTEGFELVRYFTTPPSPPPGLPWRFHGFQHHTFYEVPDSPCVVKVIFVPAFDGPAMGAHSFIIDIEVSLKEPLSALTKGLDAVLAEMHDLKNKAFFHLLTKDGIEPYK